MTHGGELEPARRVRGTLATATSDWDGFDSSSSGEHRCPAKDRVMPDEPTAGAFRVVLATTGEIPAVRQALLDAGLAYVEPIVAESGVGVSVTLTVSAVSVPEAEKYAASLVARALGRNPRVV